MEEGCQDKVFGYCEGCRVINTPRDAFKSTQPRDVSEKFGRWLNGQNSNVYFKVPNTLIKLAGGYPTVMLNQTLNEWIDKSIVYELLKDHLYSYGNSKAEARLALSFGRRG